MFKLIASDLDGTLLNSNKEISDYSIEVLKKAQEKGAQMPHGWDKAVYYRDKVLPAMEALRTPADTLEVLLGKDFWPMPTYTDLMFGIL